MLRALQKEPEKRYASVEEFSQDITRHLQRLPAKAALSGRPPRRNARQWVIGMIGVLALGIAVVSLQNHRRAAVPGIYSIAVLPFVDMSAEKNQEYFSDGLAEQLLNDLAKLHGLRVVARTSSFQFKGKNEDVRTVGEKLNVSTILGEASAKKAGT